jgi:hypothetical protein
VAGVGLQREAPNPYAARSFLPAGLPPKGLQAGSPGKKPPAVSHFLSPQREMYQSAADSSGCRLRGDRDLSRTGCCAF